MKGIPNRQKKNVVPKSDYVRAKRELWQREAGRKARHPRTRAPQTPGTGKTTGGEHGTPSD